MNLRPWFIYNYLGFAFYRQNFEREREKAKCMCIKREPFHKIMKWTLGTIIILTHRQTCAILFFLKEKEKEKLEYQCLNADYSTLNPQAYKKRTKHNAICVSSNVSNFRL